jgi:dihydrofolate reductase
MFSGEQKQRFKNAETFTSVEDVMAACQTESEIFILGGAEIYKLALTFTDKIYLTRVHHQFDAEVFFPEFSTKEWKETSRKFFPKDEKNKYDFSFLTFDRI